MWHLRVNVTYTPLQAALPGFYDPAPSVAKSLRVHYTFRGRPHYAEIRDRWPVVLPLEGELPWFVFAAKGARANADRPSVRPTEWRCRKCVFRNETQNKNQSSRQITSFSEDFVTIQCSLSLR